MPPLRRKRHVEVDEEYEEFEDDADNMSDDEDAEEFAEDEPESQRMRICLMMMLFLDCLKCMYVPPILSV